MKISNQQYAQAVWDAVNQQPDQASTVVKQFIKMLGRAKRLSKVRSIMDCIRDLDYQSRQVTPVHVTCAHPLTDEVKKWLQVELQAKGYVGKSIEWQESLNPALIGGIQVQIKDRLIDFSFKNALQQFQSQLLKVGKN